MGCTFVEMEAKNRALGDHNFIINAVHIVYIQEIYNRNRIETRRAPSKSGEAMGRQDFINQNAYPMVMSGGGHGTDHGSRSVPHFSSKRAAYHSLEPH